MLHEAITQEIIGAAMHVLNELKPGLDEKLYENALVIELHSRLFENYGSEGSRTAKLQGVETALEARDMLMLFFIRGHPCPSVV